VKDEYDIARPYTATYLIIRKGNKIGLILREKTSWMNGYWAIPAGKIEHGETSMQTAVREAKEEVGITVKPTDLKFLHTMHRSADGNVWVDFCFEVTKWTGDPHNAEPHKHKEFAWHDIDNLPTKTIPSLLFLIEQIKQGNHHSEYGWEEKTI
jgi:8-oxo-dGTP diphosphatase